MGEVTKSTQSYNNICTHNRVNPTPMQLRAYRYDDEGNWVWYHGFYLVDKGTRLEICGKPELWRWMKNVRECVECGGDFSNPWVPACKSCWTRARNLLHLTGVQYPSWQEIIRRDMRLT